MMGEEEDGERRRGRRSREMGSEDEDGKRKSESRSVRESGSGRESRSTSTSTSTRDSWSDTTSAMSDETPNQPPQQHTHPNPHNKYRRVPWLPRPRASTCKGYAKFFNVPHWPVTAYMAATSMFTKLPAYRNAPLAGRWPGENLLGSARDHEFGGSEDVEKKGGDEMGESEDEEKEDRRDRVRTGDSEGDGDDNINGNGGHYDYDSGETLVDSMLMEGHGLREEEEAAREAETSEAETSEEARTSEDGNNNQPNDGTGNRDPNDDDDEDKDMDRITGGTNAHNDENVHEKESAQTPPHHQEDHQKEEDHHQSKPTFPVVIFSHGLGGSRTLYSSICGELASHGLIVVAVEHRDGSGARTYVNTGGHAEDLDSQELDRGGDAEKGDGTEKDGLDKKASSKPTESRRKRHNYRKDRAKNKGDQYKPYYKIDYLFPKDNAQDTSPHNPIGVDKELRGAQIEMRLAEIEEAYHVLDQINRGQGEQVRQANRRCRPRGCPGRRQGNHSNNNQQEQKHQNVHVGASSAGLEGIDWADWTGRMDLASVTMMGHSFGGATTVQALRSTSDRLAWITQGVLLDPWGPATPDSGSTVNKPLLSIGSEAFMHWADNLACVERVCDEARSAGTLAWMMTIRGSTHLSQTDFAVLYPNCMSWFMKNLVDPARAISITVRSALEFLALTHGHAHEHTRLARAWPSDQLLASATPEADDIVSTYRPDDKWVAARLKIPHEFSMRLRGILRKKKKAARHGQLGQHNQPQNDEIWWHHSPSPDAVERHRNRHSNQKSRLLDSARASLEGVIA
ncbi:platelet-activating factor acetylhydrolase, isoform II-domain-containing protein [Chaetomium sp. MPI-SDFR-AT-0129]|nr:platelet-activating factor acetylhydrolase, isoform II-domain-containing protein [Chaetomium sp. MPI-SDFR-AT-0129]